MPLGGTVKQGQKRRMRPIPPIIIVALILGDIAILWISRSSIYPSIGIERPIWGDVFMMLLFDIVLLFIRDRYPKTWEMLTTEKPDSPP